MSNNRRNRRLIKQFAKSLGARLLAGMLTAAATIAPGVALAADLTVQIGAFGIAPNPDFTTQAADYGEVLVLRGDDGITRVSIGRYDSKTAAQAALARLQLAGYTDAYVTNVRGRGASSQAAAVAAPRPAPAVQPTQPTAPAVAPRTIVNPTTASSQRLPSGAQIVTPKRSAPADDGVTQAGRFRLRTHDTRSGQTTDLKLGSNSGSASGSGASEAPTTGGVVAGMRVSDIPQHLRDKLVYLDGVPHIKDGDRFIPLTDAVDGK